MEDCVASFPLCLKPRLRMLGIIVYIVRNAPTCIHSCIQYSIHPRTSTPVLQFSRFRDIMIGTAGSKANSDMFRWIVCRGCLRPELKLWMHSYGVYHAGRTIRRSIQA